MFMQIERERERESVRENMYGLYICSKLVMNVHFFFMMMQVQSAIQAVQPDYH